MEVYKIPDMGFMIFQEDYLAEINPLIDMAAAFIGTDDSLKSIACIEVALRHAEGLRKELAHTRPVHDKKPEENSK